MAEKYVSIEEFNELKNNFNELLTILEKSNIKVNADFEFLTVDSTDEDIEEEDVLNVDED